MASTSFSVKHAVVLTADSIEKVCSLLESNFGPVKIEARCADRITREFESAAELIAYDNHRVREIRRLEFESRSDENWRQNAAVTMGGAMLEIMFLMSAPSDALLLKTRAEFQDLLLELRPWYSFITSDNVLLGIFVLPGILTGVSSLARAAGFLSPAPAPARELSLNDPGALSAIFVAFVLVGIAMWLVHRLRAAFFPKVVFALGTGAQRHATKENMRWSVVVALIIGIVGSIIANQFG
jgi:hypothetical protein